MCWLIYYYSGSRLMGQTETDNINKMITITDYFYSDLLKY